MLEDFGAPLASARFACGGTLAAAGQSSSDLVQTLCILDQV